MRLSSLCLLGLGCGTIDDGRAPWLVEQLLRDNRVWLSRDPSLVAHKFERMAVDPYDYMRATAGIYLRDLERPGKGGVSTRFLTVADAATVMIVGDPHPENFGCFLPGHPPQDPRSELRVEVNDFDGVAHGPWLWDLRRGAVGLRALVEPISSCDDACSDETIEGFAHGYESAILELSSDARGPDPTDRRASLTVGRLLDRCRSRGSERRRLLGETFTDQQDRPWLTVDTELDELRRGMLDHPPEEQAQVDRLIADYRTLSPSAQILDTKRSFGRGVSSLPAVRYVFLLRESEDQEPVLIQVREVIDPAPVPGLRTPIEGVFSSQADRIKGAPEQMWSRPDADPRVEALTDGPMTFKVSTWDSYFDGFDHDRITEDIEQGRVPVHDLPALARHLGGLLAGHHARGSTADGRDSLPAIADDLAIGGPGALADELREGSAADWATTLRDYQHFLQALERFGPLLGADRLLTEERPR